MTFGIMLYLFSLGIMLLSGGFIFGYYIGARQSARHIANEFRRDPQAAARILVKFLGRAQARRAVRMVLR